MYLKIFKFLVGIVLVSFLFSCSKDSPTPDDGEVKDNQIRVYAIGQVTYLVDKHNNLWGRGSMFTEEVGDTHKGYKLIDNNVRDVDGTTSSIHILKTNNTLWSSNKFATRTIRESERNDPIVQIADNVKSISAGTLFIAMIKNDGTVWAKGMNSSGQFGLGTTSLNQPLTKIADQATQIATGFSNIYLLKNDGSLWSAGHWQFGKLGYEATEIQTTFKKVTDNVKDIRAEGNNVMYIKNDDTAWSFGSNTNGSQGIGSKSFAPVYPHKISDDVSKIYPGYYTCFFIKKDGSLWAAGSNSDGQMGLTTIPLSTEFIQVADGVTEITNKRDNLHVIGLKNGRYVKTGNNEMKQLSNSTDRKYFTFVKFELPTE